MKVKKIPFLILVLSTISISHAAEYRTQDVLRNLSGCFQVSYRYTEDGTNDQLLDGELFERIDYVEESGVHKFQHFGVVDGHAQKHWREEWKETSPGMWQQRVIGPFEDKRYECQAPFVLNQWSCSAPKSPKPRRDRKRTDYVVLDRANTLQITPRGFVQMERNVKYGKDGAMVANELGWNEYRRVDAAKCGH